MSTDQSNMLSVLESFPKQCEQALNLAKGITVPEGVTNVVVTGMGGSAVGGDILRSYLSSSKLPVMVNRDYSLPNFIGEDTLVIAVSYSGNTEETLSAVQEAQKKKAKIIAITSGGKLAQIVKTVIKIPAGYQPRAALGYLFFPLLGVLFNAGFADVRNSDLNEMLTILKDTSYFREEGKRIAKLIDGRLPIIYSSEQFAPIAYRFKTQINENAKYPAFTGVFPEMNHNEINAVGSLDRKRYVMFFIRNPQDHARIKKRMDICSQILSQKVDVEDIVPRGNSLLARMFSTMYIGDFASYELAIRLHIDPSPVEVIEWLKKKLKD